VLFSGDHVMSWNSSIVSPPDGSMAAYFESLQRLLNRDDRIFLPGHGPPLPDPRRFVHALLAHRRMREAAIARAIKQRPLTASQLVDLLYGGVDAAVKLAAECNVVAHLEKLRNERRAFVADDGRWHAA
jgi:glyoxylase-like metal-dependent hydrolase (beta-lactamase superfamily II)